MNRDNEQKAFVALSEADCDLLRRLYVAPGLGLTAEDLERGAQILKEFGRAFEPKAPDCNDGVLEDRYLIFLNGEEASFVVRGLYHVVTGTVDEAVDVVRLRERLQAAFKEAGSLCGADIFGLSRVEASLLCNYVIPRAMGNLGAENEACLEALQRRMELVFGPLEKNTGG